MTLFVLVDLVLSLGVFFSVIAFDLHQICAVKFNLNQTYAQNLFLVASLIFCVVTFTLLLLGCVAYVVFRCVLKLPKGVVKNWLIANVAGEAYYLREIAMQNRKRRWNY